MMASTRLLAAPNSQRSTRMTHRAPMASHMAGKIIALCAEEAARSAMLKPFVGSPAFANTFALRIRSLILRTISTCCQPSLYSSLRTGASFSPALSARFVSVICCSMWSKAVASLPCRIRNSISRTCVSKITPASAVWRMGFNWRRNSSAEKKSLLGAY